MEFRNELLAWRKFIMDLFPGSVIYDERARGAFERPGFRLEEASHVSIDTGNKDSGWIDQRTISLIYFGTNLADIWDKESIIIENLKRKKVIQGFLENFTYPIPFLKDIPLVGSTIGGQTIYVTVTGLRESKETLGKEVSITLASGARGVKIRVNRFPLSVPWFPLYNIYVNKTVSTPLLLSQVSQVVNKLWTEVDVGILGTGVVPPTTSEVKFRNIMIEDITTRREEDAVESGTWDLFISINTQSLGFPLREQTVDTIRTKTIAITGV